MGIKYCKGYKYQLREICFVKTNIRPDNDVRTCLVWLKKNGTLIIFKYFAWDGCSGPTIDDKTNMRAGLAHDALYYLMRVGALDKSFRRQADDELYRLMVEDGSPKWRARLYRWAVVKFGRSSLEPRKAYRL